MKIFIELDTDSAMELLLIHHAFIEKIEENGAFKRNPIATSKAIRVTDEFYAEVAKKIKTSDLNRIIQERMSEVNLCD